MPWRDDEYVISSHYIEKISHDMWLHITSYAWTACSEQVSTYSFTFAYFRYYFHINRNPLLRGVTKWSMLAQRAWHSPLIFEFKTMYLLWSIEIVVWSWIKNWIICTIIVRIIQLLDHDNFSFLVLFFFCVAHQVGVINKWYIFI